MSAASAPLPPAFAGMEACLQHVAGHATGLAVAAGYADQVNKYVHMGAAKFNAEEARRRQHVTKAFVNFMYLCEAMLELEDAYPVEHENALDYKARLKALAARIDGREDPGA